MIDLIRGTTRKEAASAALVECLEQRSDLSGNLFIGYPIIATASGPFPVDALLVSREMGIVVFDLVEGADLGDHDERQDDAANKLEAKLKLYPDLVRRRSLSIPIQPLSFAPALGTRVLSNGPDDYPLTNGETLVPYLRGLHWSDSSEKVFLSALSAIQSTSTIRHGIAKRTVDDEKSRGAKLKKLEAAIATLDPEQGKAVIETADGVQRIRGLAGSGKTIVLALKAAYLHAQHPEWRIAVTFNTRSLKGQFRRFINTFCLAQIGEEPDWEHLRVVNAWGAPGGPERDGIYYEFCRVNDVPYLDFGSARAQYGTDSAFQQACRLAFQQATGADPVYDAMLVDEAQDFLPTSCSFATGCLVLRNDWSMLTTSCRALPASHSRRPNRFSESTSTAWMTSSCRDVTATRVRSLRPPTPSDSGFIDSRRSGMKSGSCRCSTTLSCGKISDIGAGKVNCSRDGALISPGPAKRARYFSRITRI